MGSASSARILIVDDDAELGAALSDALALAGYRCDLALSGPAALDEVAHSSFDAIISDVTMDGMTGLQLLETLTRDKPQLPVIIMTGLSSAGVDAIDKGAFHYLVKPLDIEQLRGVIEQAIGDRAGLGDVRPSDVLLPISAATRTLIARIDLVASANSPVLIQGESGTGKELVARAVHDRGRRSQAPFIAINTAAIPEHLLESELFGHVRGAFSGATQARRGLLTEADHGTVLLDEIGDMPLGLQAKLLRVIQSGEVRPIGSDRSHVVDVRFLAATHRDLGACIEKGTFRADLYFRLNVLALEVPPLRHRRAEIPALATHFLARAREQNPGSPVRLIAPDAMHALMQAHWPGNVRELASVVERLAVLGQTAVVTLSDLSKLGFPGLGAPPPRSMPLEQAPLEQAPLEQAPLEQAQRELWSLEQLNHNYVDWVLEHAKGDKLEAARILGVNISTVYRWLRAAPA